MDHTPRRSTLRDLRWRIRDDLVRARRFYDLNPGDLRLLDAMLSFLGEDVLVCYAKNEKIKAKAGGMSPRSISRHAMQLGKLGFLVRNDSPNFKRGVRRTHKKAEVYYGFDLSPFFERAAEFKRRAQDADDQDVALGLTFDRLTSLRLRLEALSAGPELAAEIRRARRWEWSPALPGILSDLECRAQAALAALGDMASVEGAAAPAPLDEPCPSPAPGSSTVSAAQDDQDAPAAQGAPHWLVQAVDNTTEPTANAEGMATNDGQSGRQYQSRYDRVFSSPSSVTPQAEQKEKMIAMKLEREDRPLATSRPALADPDAGPEAGLEARSVASPLPYEDQRREMADYVQSVLASFRHKLGVQPRPSREAAPKREARPAPEARAEKSEAVRGDAVSGQLKPAARSIAAQSSRRPVRCASAALSVWAGGDTRNCTDLPTITEVLEACPDGLALSGKRPSTWSQMFDAAWRLGGWMGIPPANLAKACAQLGREGLAVTLFAINERLASVREPTAYLLAVSARSGFRPGDLLARPRNSLVAG